MSVDLSVVPEHFRRYVQLITEEGNILDILAHQTSLDVDFYASISAEKSTFRYAENKWTIKEVLQHVIDTERIFQFRALCIARNESQALNGFDENAYAKAANGNHRSWEDLQAEFHLVRQASLALFRSFELTVWKNSGKVGNYEITVEGLIYSVLGHSLHHEKIIRERYL